MQVSALNREALLSDAQNHIKHIMGFCLVGLFGPVTSKFRAVFFAHGFQIDSPQAPAIHWLGM